MNPLPASLAPRSKSINPRSRARSQCGRGSKSNLGSLPHSRIVAFAWGIFAGGAYQNLFVGLDYGLNNEFDLYFNLMANDLDHALRLGAREIQMGQTADVFKSRLGGCGHPRYVYAKGARWFTAAPLRWTHRLLMPAPPAPPVRELYRDKER